MDSAVPEIGDSFGVARQLLLIKLCSLIQQARNTAALMQQGDRLREADTARKLNEPDHIAASSTAVAVEQALAGIDQKARFPVRM
jgi:hypothetical protein